MRIKYFRESSPWQDRGNCANFTEKSKKSTKLYETFRGWDISLATSRFDFGADPDPDPDPGILTALQ